MREYSRGSAPRHRVSGGSDRPHACPRASILESVTDTARVLLTAALLSSMGLGVYAWLLARTDPAGPERLVGQLRLAQWMALILASSGAASIGFAVTTEPMRFGTVDVTMGVAFVVFAAWLLQREPREALLLAAIGLILH